MKRAIIFDFFGVICSEVAPRWFKKNLPAHDLTKLQQNVMLPGDLGHKTLEDLYGELGVMTKQEPTDIAEEFQQLITINSELVSYIETLRVDYKVGLCSNAFGSFIRPILESNNLTKLFDVITISSEVQLAKPDKEIYILTATKLGVTPEKCIFIDDNATNVSVSEELGMKGILFTSNETLKSSLVK